MEFSRGPSALAILPLPPAVSIYKQFFFQYISIYLKCIRNCISSILEHTKENI
jgi:hypothetical protein